MRGKDAYEAVKDEKTGKMSVQKLGVGAKQRDGFEYDFTCTFLIDQKTSTSEVLKDNTHLFENEGPTILTEAHGAKIIKWANSGEGYTPVVRKSDEDVVDMAAGELKAVKTDIIALCKELGGSSNETLMNTIKEYAPSGNPNAIRDINKAKELLGRLQNLPK